jgi:hypothetical protein
MKLTVRSPSAVVNRLLGIIEAAKMTGVLEQAALDRVHLGAEQIHQRRFDPPRRPPEPSEDVRLLTAVPADHDVVDGALRLVVELAATCVGGADGASVSLLRHGRISTVAASNQIVMDMDTDQYATGQGPCLDASMQGSWFHAEALATETRWPAFTPKARDLGINAILSSPLHALERPVGALNIYSRSASVFDAKAQETAAVFARKASVILSDARAGMTDLEVSARFQQALRSREVISLAKGIIMERDGVDEEEAFSVLRSLSRAEGLPLRGRAERVVLSARPARASAQGGPW